VLHSSPPYPHLAPTNTSKNPSTKHQISNKFEILPPHQDPAYLTNVKIKVRDDIRCQKVLGFGDLNLGIIWDLEIWIWDF